MPDPSEEQWLSFSENLGRALQLPDSERDSWLKTLAGSQPGVAAEIERKLSVRNRKGFSEFLSNSIFSPQDKDRQLVGRRIGPYKVECEIGGGDMRSVWRARRTDGSNESVAIKFVHHYWIGRAGEQRFRGEGRLLGRLDHPNIARLIDTGVFNDSQPYLVQEFVEGEPIDEYCDRLNLGVAARVELFRDVLSAVEHAHSRLVIHRELKPDNIFVTHDGVVKLLDFGIAKLLSEEAAAAATQSYTLALAPQYAAPEQLLGQCVTTATDLYSLGLVLYLLLTGKHAIALEGRSITDLINAVINDVPAVASSVLVGPTSRRRELKGDLDCILGKALEKVPAERYSSVGAMAQDLNRFLKIEPVSVHPDRVTYRLAKFMRRNRGIVIAGFLIIVGLIATSVVAFEQLHAIRLRAMP